MFVQVPCNICSFPVVLKRINSWKEVGISHPSAPDTSRRKGVGLVMNNMGYSLGFCLVTGCASLHAIASTAGGPATLLGQVDLSQAPGGNLCRYVVHTMPLDQATILHNASTPSARACGVTTLLPPQGPPPDHERIAAYCAALPQTHLGCSRGSVWARRAPQHDTHTYIHTYITYTYMYITTNKNSTYIQPQGSLPTEWLTHVFITLLGAEWLEFHTINHHTHQQDSYAYHRSFLTYHHAS